MEQKHYDVFISYSRKDYKDKNNNIIPDNIVSKIKEALTIHPISIEPRAELPSDMKDDYNFEVI